MPPIFDFPAAVASVQNGETINAATEKLLTQLTTGERLNLLDGDAPFYRGLVDLVHGHYSNRPWSHGATPRLNIPGLQFTDGPRGLVLGSATAFPVPMARGATWDPELETRVGHAIGLEARASGANLLGSTCINLPRHPAWGRAQEVYGEDPVLLGEMGAAHVCGVQRNAMACVKHYALNSIEKSRFKVDVQVDETNLHDVYLPHWRRVVEAGALSLMTAYNSVNGQWASQNKMLLTDILREQWGFDGFTISDWVFGVRDGVLSLKNGLDVEAPFINLRARYLPDALERGEISWTEVDRSAFRILSSLLRHYANRDTLEPTRDVILSQQHLELAREVANRSIVLLENKPVGNSEQQPLLPLPRDLSSCAVIGRLARSKHTGDEGSSMVNCPRVVSPYEGLKAALPNTSISLSDSDDVKEAVEAAKHSEVAIIIAGYDGADEGEFLAPSFENNADAFNQVFPPSDGSPEAAEVSAFLKDANKSALEGRARGGDRASIYLREKDIRIIKAVAKVNPRTIVSIITGGAVVTESFRHNVPALLVSWYNGAEGGTALADVLTGQVNPSGCLPWSMPKHEGHLPYFNPGAESIQYDQFFSQRYYIGHGHGTTAMQPAYPLGFGLSYTSFKLSNLHVVPSGHGCGYDPSTESLTLTLDVTNTGDREGRCVIQVYGRPLIVAFPPISLGFTPVDLKMHETKSVKCIASVRPLQTWSKQGREMWMKKILLDVGRFAGDRWKVTTSHSFGGGS